MAIAVFGLGFVGLTTALGFAHYGQTVYGVDTDRERTALLAKGKLPFLEKGLDAALKDNLGKRFFLADRAEDAVKNSSVIFYCVGTPCGENGEADLSYLFSAIDRTLENLGGEKKLLVVKSTVPPATAAERVIPYIESKGLRVGRDVSVANNPEFLREGHCWDDFVHPDRIVFGCSDPEGAGLLEELYRPFRAPVFPVTLNTAEFVKYLSNSFLAAMISYSNEMSMVAKKFGGIDLPKAFRIFHMDKRWGGCGMTAYAYPGCGYGGYCLPKDTDALLAAAKSRGAEPAILEDVVRTNEKMPAWIASRIAARAAPSDTIGVLGLSFKPQSDDVRDCAPAKIIRELLGLGYRRLIGYDPVASEAFRKQYALPIAYAGSLAEICGGADVLAILTAWPEFGPLKENKGLKILDFRYM